jgi:hypothetical protein
MLKSISAFVRDVVVILGSLACIFVWLKIDPKDVGMLTLPPLFWLFLGIALAACGISLSTRSLYLSTIKLRRMEKQHVSDLEQKRLSMFEEIQAKHPASSIFEIQRLRDQLTQKTGKLQELDARHGQLKHELELARVDNGRLMAESKEDREETVRWKQQAADLEQKLASVDTQVKTDISDLHIPDVTGSVAYVKLTAHGYIKVRNNVTVHCELDIKVTLQNLSPESSEIRKLTLTSLGDRGCRCLLNMLDTPITLSSNATQGLIVIARIEFDDDGSHKIPSPLALIATDSHNAKYWVPIRATLPEIPTDSASASEGL